MKKKNEIKKKLSLDKFKIAEFKTLRVIVGGGDGDGSGTAATGKIPPVEAVL